MGRARPLCTPGEYGLNSLLLGMSLGLGAGISPGPLLTLVITRSLARGLGAGMRVAMAPLLADAPIILVSVLVFSALPPTLEIALTVGGGLFIIYLGVETLRTARHAHLAQIASGAQPASTDLWHGVLVNSLSPHPWLFWITVGGPLLTTAWRTNWWSAFAFLLGFYCLLVGSKMTIAMAVAGGRHFLSDAWYRRLLVLSGLLLCLWGALLLWRLVQTNL